jgi:hypothetical protein
VSYRELAAIAEAEFSDVILQVDQRPEKLRLHLIDGSYVDIWYSVRLEGRFAYHWERRMINGSVYRYDNRPHEHLKGMKSYPKHFHDGSEAEVRDCEFGDDPKVVLRAFLQVVRAKLQGWGVSP